MTEVQLSNFEAVAFDFEGTLADTIPAHHEARFAAFSQHGFGHITREQHALGPTYGSSTPDIIGGVLYAAGEIDKTGPFKEHPVVQEVMATKNQLFKEVAANGFNAMPSAVAFVKAIAIAKFGGHMALVTTAPEEYVYPFLERYELCNYFPQEFIIGEDTIVAEGLDSKPAPDPYSLAMHRLRASRMLAFEDTVSGVASAKLAGAVALALGFDAASTKLFLSGKLEHAPDFFVHDYYEAADLLGLAI